MKVSFLGAELSRWDQLLRERSGRPSCLGLPFFEDERPLRGAAGLCDWRLGGRLSALIGASGPARVIGAFGEKVLLPTGPRLPFSRLVLFGLGPIARFDEAAARRAGRALLQALAALGDAPEARVEPVGKADTRDPPVRPEATRESPTEAMPEATLDDVAEPARAPAVILPPTGSGPIVSSIAIVPPGRSTGALSARRALELLLDEAAVLGERARLTIVESLAGQKEAGDLARR